MERLEVTMASMGGRVVVVLSGALTGGDAAKLHQFLSHFDGDITVDMSRLTVVDAVGLGALYESNTAERRITLLNAAPRLAQAIESSDSSIRLERSDGDRGDGHPSEP
jgi:anti-anti-sigma regulatory factor